jgi:DNA-binding IclR family transcriptional regulator
MAVLATMKQIGAPASPKEIAALADMKANNVTKLLTRMVEEATVHRLRHGKYEIVVPDRSA